MPKSNLTIDNSLGDTGEPVAIQSDGSIERSAESENRSAESEGTTSGTIAGFPAISPFDVESGSGQPVYSSGSNSGPGIPTGKRRGRPPGSTNRPKDPNAVRAQGAAENLAGLESLLLSVHMMGARMMDIPELEIDESESKRLAGAVKEVAKHYSFAIDPKHMALWQLGTCMASIYVPRVQQFAKRKPGKPKLVSIDRTQAQPTEPEKPKPVENRTEAREIHSVQVAPSALWPVPPGEVNEL